MPLSLTFDFSAPVSVFLILRAGVGGTLTVQVKQGGVPVDLAGAAIRYKANTNIPINKTVGSGITVVAPPSNGTFNIIFDDADTSSQNVTQGKEHECKLQLAGGEPVAVFEGKLMIEQSLFTTV